jgi:hypothetical protein
MEGRSSDSLGQSLTVGRRPPRPQGDGGRRDGLHRRLRLWGHGPKPVEALKNEGIATG